MRRNSFSSCKVNMITSNSDDKLYRKSRDINEPLLNTIQLDKIKTSNGRPLMESIVDIEFEGDGPLGIVFKNNDENLVVSKILPRTVASEYYNIKINMKLLKINNESCQGSKYLKTMEKLGKIWRNENKIILTFENIILDEIFQLLEKNDCSDYYENFISMGANTIDDLQFLEYEDLINMNIPRLKRRKLINYLLKNNNIDLDVNKSKMYVYLNDKLKSKDKMNLLDKLQTLEDHFYIEIINDVATDV